MLAEASHAPDIKAPAHLSLIRPSKITFDCSKRGSGVTVHLNFAAMDSRTMFVLLWMLLSSTSTGIKLDGNGYVDIVIAISSKVPQDNTLVDKIKVNMFCFCFLVYLTNFMCINRLMAFVKNNILSQLEKKIKINVFRISLTVFVNEHIKVELLFFNTYTF